MTSQLELLELLEEIVYISGDLTLSVILANNRQSFCLLIPLIFFSFFMIILSMVLLRSLLRWLGRTVFVTEPVIMEWLFAGDNQ